MLFYFLVLLPIGWLVPVFLLSSTGSKNIRDIGCVGSLSVVLSCLACVPILVFLPFAVAVVGVDSDLVS